MTIFQRRHCLLYSRTEWKCPKTPLSILVSVCSRYESSPWFEIRWWVPYLTVRHRPELDYPLNSTNMNWQVAWSPLRQEFQTCDGSSTKSNSVMSSTSNSIQALQLKKEIQTKSMGKNSPVLDCSFQGQSSGQRILINGTPYLTFSVGVPYVFLLHTSFTESICPQSQSYLINMHWPVSLHSLG